MLYGCFWKLSRVTDLILVLLYLRPVDASSFVPNSTKSIQSADEISPVTTISNVPGIWSTKIANPAWTSNTIFTTSLSENSSSTVLPVLYGCSACGGDHHGLVLVGLPSIVPGDAVFDLPGLPAFEIGPDGGPQSFTGSLNSFVSSSLTASPILASVVPSSQLLISPSSSAFISDISFISSLSLPSSKSVQSTFEDLAISSSALRSISFTPSSTSSATVDSSLPPSSSELYISSQSYSSNTKTGELHSTLDFFTVTVTATIPSGTTQTFDIPAFSTPFTITAPSTAPTTITSIATYSILVSSTPAAEASSLSVKASSAAAAASSYASAQGMYGEDGIELSPEQASFARLPACTASYISAHPDAFSSTTEVDVETIVAIGSTTFTKVNGDLMTFSGPSTFTYPYQTATWASADIDQVCCGQCNIYFNNIQVFYWPVPDANTACLTNSSYYPDYQGRKNRRALKTLNMGSNSVHHGLNKWVEPEPPLTTLQARMTLNEVIVRNGNFSLESFAIIEGTTIVSPSVYVDFGDVSASNACGQVGSTYNSVRMIFAPGELSTTLYKADFTPKSFDFGDLPCPPLSVEAENWYDDMGDPQGAYHPNLAAPSKLLAYDPAWSSCMADMYQGYDPPRAMTPVSVLVLSTSSQDSDPISISADPGPVVQGLPVPTDSTFQMVTTAASGSQIAPPGPSAVPTEVGPLISSTTSEALSSNTDIPNIGSLTVSFFLSGPEYLTTVEVLSGSPRSSSYDPETSNGASEIDLGDLAKSFNFPTTRLSPPSPPTTTGTAPAPTVNPPDPQSQVQTNQISKTLGGNAVIVQGQTLTENGPSKTIGTIPVAYKSGSIYAGTDPEPVSMNVNGQQQKGPNQVIAEGLTFFPVSQQAPGPTQINVGGQTVSIGPDGAVLVGSNVVSSGAAAITISSIPVSLGSSGLIIGTSTYLVISSKIVQPTKVGNNLNQAAATAFAIAGTTISAGGSQILISGTPVSVAPSGKVVIGGTTMELPTPSIFSVGDQIFTANPTAFSISGTTISAGGPGVTISGTVISLAHSGTLAIGLNTFPLPSAGAGSDTDSGAVFTVGGQTFTAIPTAFTIPGIAMAPSYTSRTLIGFGSSMLVIGSTTIQLLPSASVIPLTIDGQTFTPETGGFVVAGATLREGGSGTTISGTPISVALSGLVIGSSTFLVTFPTSVFSVGTEVITANPTGFRVGSDSIIVPGGMAITVDGTIISLAPSGALVIGTRTIPLMASTSQGFGAVIMSGFGRIGPSTPTSIGATDSFAGGQPMTSFPNMVFLISGVIICVILVML